MFPVSNKGGGAVLGFPDVCKTPAGSTAPAPTPGVTAAQRPAGQNAAAHVNVRRAVAVANGGVGPLRSRLTLLHSTLMSLSGAEPARWHETLDEYVLVTAELYKALATR